MSHDATGHSGANIKLDTSESTTTTDNKAEYTCNQLLTDSRISKDCSRKLLQWIIQTTYQIQENQDRVVKNLLRHKRMCEELFTHIFYLQQLEQLTLTPQISRTRKNSSYAFSENKWLSCFSSLNYNNRTSILNGELENF